MRLERQQASAGATMVTQPLESGGLTVTGALLCVGFADGSIALLDANKGTEIYAYAGQGAQNHAVQFLEWASPITVERGSVRAECLVPASLTL